jgi:hypothetical protein
LLGHIHSGINVLNDFFTFYNFLLIYKHFQVFEQYVCTVNLV